MLGTLPDQVSCPFEVTSKTVRTVQMCSQAGDTANNSLQLEAARGTVMHVNHLPPSGSGRMQCTSYTRLSQWHRY